MSWATVGCGFGGTVAGHPVSATAEVARIQKALETLHAYVIFFIFVNNAKFIKFYPKSIVFEAAHISTRMDSG